MANAINAFFQTLVAETAKASAVLAPTWNLCNSIFWDYSPVPATIGQTVNIPLPIDPGTQPNPPSNILAGDTVIADIGFNTKSIVFDQHPEFTYQVKDWEQFNSPSLIRTTFVDAAMKGLQNWINAAIVGLITTTNLNAHLWNSGTKSWTAGTVFYPATGSTGKCLSVQEFLYPSATTGGLFSRLSDFNVPVQSNPENMSLVLGTVPYARLLDTTTSGGVNDPNWATAWQAGMGVTDQVRKNGVMPSVFGFTAKLDQQMPVSGTAPSRTFTGIYLHKYAIAAIGRPLPEPGKTVDFEYVQMKANPEYAAQPPGSMKLPIRVMVGYNQYPKLGYIVTIDAGFGMRVVRPEMAIGLTIAE